MKPKNNRVLVSGGSIAGSTVAFWLARYGFDVTLVEISPELRAGGNGVDVRGLAIDVVKRMGLWPQVQAAAIDLEGMSFINKRGRSISRVNMKTIKRRAKSEEVEIQRGDLAAIIYAAAKDSVTYMFDNSIASMKQTNDSVEVAFAKGASRQFDIVIGADGIHSHVRSLAFGPEAQYVRFKQHYFAFADADPSLGDKGWMSLYNRPGQMAGIYSAHNQPGAKAYFAFYRDKPLSYDYHNIDQQKRLLTEGLADMGWVVSDLLRGAKADPNFYFDSLSQVIMPSWSNGRVVLVGDAAYCASPVTGAGASLSLMGAYRLAGELALAEGNYSEAFQKYEAGYRSTVEKAQSELFTGVVVPKSRWSLWTRNLLTKLPVMGVMAGLERRLGTDKTAQLPRYNF